jgi:hypothetical protein
MDLPDEVSGAMRASFSTGRRASVTSNRGEGFESGISNAFGALAWIKVVPWSTLCNGFPWGRVMHAKRALKTRMFLRGDIDV